MTHDPEPRTLDPGPWTHDPEGIWLVNNSEYVRALLQPAPPVTGVSNVDTIIANSLKVGESNTSVNKYHHMPGQGLN